MCEHVFDSVGLKEEFDTREPEVTYSVFALQLILWLSIQEHSHYFIDVTELVGMLESL